MSFADHVRELTETIPAKCKTCLLLAKLSPADRAAFDEYKGQVYASVLAIALSASLAESGITETVAEGSVRKHVASGHAL